LNSGSADRRRSADDFHNKKRKQPTQTPNRDQRLKIRCTKQKSLAGRDTHLTGGRNEEINWRMTKDRPACCSRVHGSRDQRRRAHESKSRNPARGRQQRTRAAKPKTLRGNLAVFGSRHRERHEYQNRASLTQQQTEQRLRDLGEGTEKSAEENESTGAKRRTSLDRRARGTETQNGGGERENQRQGRSSGKRWKTRRQNLSGRNQRPATRTRDASGKAMTGRRAPRADPVGDGKNRKAKRKSTLCQGRPSSRMQQGTDSKILHENKTSSDQ
jgi:hypothetical protein